MRKLRFQTSADNELFVIHMPEFTGLRKSQKLLKLLAFAGSIVYWVFLFTLPISQLFNLTVFENAVFHHLLIFIVVLIAFMIAIVILNGKTRLIDPPNLLAVLFFALLTTTAAVLVYPPNIANTFGIDSYRSLAGLVVMGMIGLFYAIQFFVKDKPLFRKSYYALLSGLLIVTIVTILQGSEAILRSMDILLLTVAFLLGILLYYRKDFFKLVIPMALIIILSTLSLTDPNVNLVNVTYLQLSALIGYLVVVIVAFRLNFNSVRTAFKDLANLITNKEEVSINLYKIMVIVVVPLLFLIATLVPSLLVKNSQTSLNLPFEQLAVSIRSISNFSTFNFNAFKRIAIGTGSQNLVDYSSLLSNIVLVQGLLGLLAYLFLWVFGIVKGINAMKKAEGNRAFVAVFLFILVFVPVISFFTYPGLLMVVLWWVSFSLITVYSRINRRSDDWINEEENWDIKAVNIRGRKRVLINIVGVALVALASVFVLVSLSNVKA